MKNQTIYLLSLLFTILTTSCSKDDEESIVNFEGVTTCEFGPSGSGICLDGPDIVIPGRTYTYAFKISKRETVTRFTEFLLLQLNDLLEAFEADLIREAEKEEV